MKKKNKAIRFLGSMQFAMILLAVLIAACILGSVIEQGQTFALYSEVYGERAAAAIVALPAAKEWTTERGLEVFGPRSFGYDIDYKPFC